MASQRMTVYSTFCNVCDQLANGYCHKDLLDSCMTCTPRLRFVYRTKIQPLYFYNFTSWNPVLRTVFIRQPTSYFLPRIIFFSNFSKLPILPVPLLVYYLLSIQQVPKNVIHNLPFRNKFAKTL